MQKGVSYRDLVTVAIDCIDQDVTEETFNATRRLMDGDFKNSKANTASPHDQHRIIRRALSLIMLFATTCDHELPEQDVTETQGEKMSNSGVERIDELFDDVYRTSRDSAFGVLVPREGETGSSVLRDSEVVLDYINSMDASRSIHRILRAYTQALRGQ